MNIVSPVLTIYFESSRESEPH